MTDFSYDTTPNLETIGEFRPGTSVAFFFSFPDLNGDLFDPSTITVSIADPSDTEVVTDATTERLETGRYVYEWSIPSTEPTGLHTIEVTYVEELPTESVTSSFTEQFVVTQTGDTYLDQMVLGSRALLEAFLGCSQAIPVYNETGRMDGQRKVAEFTFPRWNQTAGVRVYVNDNRTDLGFDVNYLLGKITFTNALSQYDHVTADYNFRWFKDGDLDNFIQQAIQIFNQYPPHSYYLLWDIPSRYGVMVIEQAAVFAIRQLMMCLMFQQPAKVFGGIDRADKMMGQLETLKQNYETELNKLYEQKKLGPYVGLTRTVVTPEFTLPGGRSRWFRALFK